MKAIEINEYYGWASKPSKAKIPIGFAQSITNFHDIDLSTPGVAKTRGGIDTLATLSGGPTVRRIHDFYLPSANTHTAIIHAGTKLYTMTDAGATAEIQTGLTDGEVMDMLNYGNDLFLCSGVSGETKIYNGTATRKWGITGPAAANTFAALSGTGLTGAYYYRFAYVNSTSGHISTASTASAVQNPVNQTVNLTGLTASADAQVNKINIYRTTAGGAIYYYLTQIDNGTTTYADSTADASLGTAEAPLYNDVPPDFFGIEEWDGRIFGFKKNSTLVYFTNDEYYTQTGNPQESVHPDNYIDFKAKVYGIKKSPNFNELWAHTSKGVYAVLRTELDQDPYRPVIRNSKWNAINHYSIQNLYTEQYFMYEAGKFMSMDSAGNVGYESYLQEPDISAGNLTKFNTMQSANYRKGTKNQYVCNFVVSGQTTATRLLVANYLMKTPVMETGRSYPVWEYHKISSTAVGVVVNSSGQDILYVGTTDGKIKKCDTSETDDDGTAIDWAHSIGWMRSSEKVANSNMARWVVQYFNPLGSWNITLQTNMDFGYTGGQTYSVNFTPDGDLLDVDFTLDVSLLGAENALLPVCTDIGGVYTHIELVWSGSVVNQTVELHTVCLLAEQIEGFRRVNNR